MELLVSAARSTPYPAIMEAAQGCDARRVYAIAMIVGPAWGFPFAVERTVCLSSSPRSLRGGGGTKKNVELLRTLS